MEFEPIEYTAFRYSMNFSENDAQSNKQAVLNLIQILATTDQIVYFGTPYIQKFIDYQWSSNLKKAYGIILALYLSEFSCVVFAAQIINGLETELRDSKIRMVVSVINACLILLSVGLFECKQLVK
jgi:hypothetical protein